MFFTGPTFTLVVDPGVPTSAPILQASLSADQLTVSWTNIGKEYEVAQADAIGTPISVDANGVTVYSTGSGTLENDPSGVLGFFTADLSMLADIPAGTTTRWIVRGVNGVGPSTKGGPWSSAVTVKTPPGQPLMAISAATLAVTAGGDLANDGTRLPVATSNVQETNEGNGAGTEQGWSGVVVGPDGIVYSTPNFSGGGNTLQPGGSDTQSYQQGMGGYSSPPPSGTYTLYVALGQGYGSITVGSRFSGPLSNTTTATAYWA